MDFDHDNVRLVVNEDRLSNLPDELIHRILSFIDTKFVVQTCLTSSRWKHLWKSVPCLVFNKRDFDPLPKSTKFVTNVLSHRNHEVDVSSVKLDFHGAGQVLIRKLASYAYSHNVQELIIISSPKNDRAFPPCLFSSRTLKHFTLSTIWHTPCCTPKTPWDFPALTSLNLSDITLGDNTRGPVDLFSKCVNLKNLTLERFVVGATVFDINAPQLSNLVLIDGRGSNVNNIIAPQLESLTVINSSIMSFNATPRLSSLVYKGYSFYGPPSWFKDCFTSLNKVTFSLFLYNSKMPYEEEDARTAIKMLEYLHSAKFLTLNLDIIECISSFPDLVSPHPSPFRNLICLNIDSSRREYYKVKMSTEARNFLLENSPSATFIMKLPKEEPTKAMKAKEAREKKKAKLIADIETHMTELRTLLKQANSHIERKQAIEMKKTTVEILMAELQQLLTKKKMTQSEPERAEIEAVVRGLMLQIVYDVQEMSNMIQQGRDDILPLDLKMVLVRCLLEKLPKLQKAHYSAQLQEIETLYAGLRSTFDDTFDDTFSYLKEVIHALCTMCNSPDLFNSKHKLLLESSSSSATGC